MPPPSQGGRPKKGAHDTRAPPAPARETGGLGSRRRVDEDDVCNRVAL